MTNTFYVPTMASLAAEGRTPEYLFWVGSAGSYDDRAKRIVRTFAHLLNKASVDFAVLGTEESDTGDPAKRAGNEFLFQMQALTNIQILDSYNVKKIVTTCPHVFNTLKNEYPALGGNYQVWHHTEFLKKLIDEKKLPIDIQKLNGKRITFHDPCYLGRGNGIYNAPREILQALGVELLEMQRTKSRSVCCGAGGAQMFKEPEKGNKDINVLRTEQALAVRPQVIATACPFCNTMLTDGIKFKEKEQTISVLDIAELLYEGLKETE
ncbi:(Fe-S)-binding protein [Capnocytophaga sp.]|uniref:(Fe-S)-binding protein n=1 Tax=Capnocytophaga sp. TaxID=44737 RepID=UPI0026DD1A23|nr:(Fe-S)-binding protein [Capnocytophaga sp.]MDO5106398.1 (Fe-S)-binding protein [Capnocytophaga sp.]